MDTDNFIVYIKQMIFTKIWKKMLKQDLTLQIKNQKGCYQKGKIEK